MLNIKGHHPVGSRRRNFDGAERSCITGLKMQMITVTLSRTKCWRWTQFTMSTSMQQMRWIQC